jgi:hypothetical protein
LDDTLKLYLDAAFSDLKNQIAGISADQADTDGRVTKLETRVGNLEVKEAKRTGAEVTKMGVAGAVGSALGYGLSLLGNLLSGMGIPPHHH